MALIEELTMSIRSCLQVIGFAFVLFLGGAGEGRAVIIQVPADYVTIQAAIDAAVPGDEVRVTKGIYRGPGNKNLDFGGKDIRVVSQSGPEQTVIDCEKDGRGLFLHNSETHGAVFEGFTIRSGSSYKILGSPAGGGIQCNQASPTIRKCNIQGCFDGAVGGGVCLYNSQASIIECEIRGNVAGSEMTANGFGGGIFIDQYSSVTLDHCTVVNNRAGNMADIRGGVGGGMYCAGSATMIGCKLSGNRAEDKGGALAAAKTTTTLTLSQCVLTGNQCAVGGGAIYSDGAPVTLQEVTVSANRCLGPAAAGGGGLLCLRGGKIDCQSTILWGNCSLGHPGDEALIDDVSTLTFVCCNADSNLVQGAGTITYSKDHMTGDPLFCQPYLCGDTPMEKGDYSLQFKSPCSVTASPCGRRIGALPEVCGSRD
jgi:predicted outer membrane repeat protein